MMGGWGDGGMGRQGDKGTRGQGDKERGGRGTITNEPQAPPERNSRRSRRLRLNAIINS